MNLLEVIFALHGVKAGERRRLLVGWGVNPALWTYIMPLFTDEGKFTEPTKRVITEFLSSKIE